MSPTTFSHDAQLREEDAELFFYSDVSWQRRHVRAATDLTRDLQRHGYLEHPRDVILDASQRATVELVFTADVAAELVVPAGTRVRVFEAGEGYTHGVVSFLTDEALTVPAGSSATVSATAEEVGEVYNVAAGTLAHVDGELASLAAVTNPGPASGGRDHQLTRAAVYRVMELVYTDLCRSEDDAFEYRRKIYRRMYHDELDRLVAAGVDIDRNGDGEVSVGERGLAHGFHRFRRS